MYRKPTEIEKFHAFFKQYENLTTCQFSSLKGFRKNPNHILGYILLTLPTLSYFNIF